MAKSGSLKPALLVYFNTKEERSAVHSLADEMGYKDTGKMISALIFRAAVEHSQLGTTRKTLMEGLIDERR